MTIVPGNVAQAQPKGTSMTKGQDRARRRCVDGARYVRVGRLQRLGRQQQARTHRRRCRRPSPTSTSRPGLSAYPADPFFFAGSTDGTVNIEITLPTRPGAMRTALNSPGRLGPRTVEPWTRLLDAAAAVVDQRQHGEDRQGLPEPDKAPVDVTDANRSRPPTCRPDGTGRGPVAGVLT